MFGLSFWEIGLIMLVALVVLGPKRLPALAKTLGKGLRELRKASTDLRSAIEEPLQEVKRPLEEMRDDLVDTVYRIEDQIEGEAGSANALEQAAEDAGHPPGQLTEGTPEIPEDEEPVEVDESRRQVEAVYEAANASEAEAEADTDAEAVAEHEGDDGGDVAKNV